MHPEDTTPDRALPAKVSPASQDDDYLPTPSQELESSEGDRGRGVENTASGGPLSGDPSQLVLKKQLVDIAKRLKREVEEKDQEIYSLREAQGDPVALQKLVEKSQDEIRALEERLKNQEKKLTEAESMLRHKDSELSSVKSVLMRRAEKSGESKKQLEDVTASFVAIGEEKKALAVANDKLTADLRAAQDELRGLRQSREMDQKSFRDAAEMTVKWKMEEVEKQLEHLRSELKIKRDECADTVKQLHTVQQQLASEQTLSRSTSSKLQEALSELKRMRESNVKFDASAKEYKEHCATLERELAASGQRSAALSQTVEECKRMLEEASASHAEKLRNNDAAWEGRMWKLQVEMQESATQHETVIEDHHVKYALLQSEMEEARELMGEARTKILTLEDEKKAAIEQTEKLASELAEASSRVAELDTKCHRLQSELEKLQQLNGETIEEMKASFLDEEESLQAELRDAKDKAEKLSDATQKLKDKVRVCVYHTVPLCLCMPL